jgi:4-hydroxy-tetrahydrodipicolinate synthase
MAYNIPGRTATLIELDTLKKLVDDIGIHSIKDAVGDLEFSKLELEALKDKVDIYSGNDSETIEFMKMGGKGVVSVASHVVGKEIYQLIESVSADEIEAAEQIQNTLMPIFDKIFEEPSPGPVKYLLTETWEDVGSPLMPITDITPDLANKILDYYKKIKKD